MAVVVTGVPEKISRTDYLRMVESVGFELNDLVSLIFHVDSIEAVVLARAADGRCYAQPDTGDTATHHISIRVED